MAKVIDIRGLHKSFGSTRALDGLDLAVEAGEVHGFLGPNGAGKSTTIRVLLGLLRADAGDGRGCSAATRGATRSTLHRRLAYVPGDVEPVAEPDRRRGDRPARPAARRARRTARRDELLERFDLDPTQEGPRLLQGQPAEGRAGRRARLRRRAADPRRADLRARPADGGGLPATCIGEAAADGRAPCCCPATSCRGRGALRPGQHHPRRPDRRDRHPRRAAPPHPHLDRRRAGRPADGLAELAGRARPRGRRPPGRPSRSTPPTSTRCCDALGRGSACAS